MPDDGGAAAAAPHAAASPAAAAAAPNEAVLTATRLVREGRVFRLARERFPGMPLFPGHPAFSVLAYRTRRACGPRASARGASTTTPASAT